MKISDPEIKNFKIAQNERVHPGLKRLLNRFWIFWTLTALDFSKSNTGRIRSKQCLLKKCSRA